MPKGNLSYNSYTACVRDAKANGVSTKECAGLVPSRNNAGMNPGGFPNSSGNNMPQPQPGSIKGYGGPGITPQPNPRLAPGNQAMSGQGGNMRRRPGQNLPVQPGGPGRRPMQNQVMSGNNAGMRPANMTGPGQERPRPIRKRGRGPAPVPPAPGMRRRTY